MSALCSICEGIFEAAFRLLTNKDPTEVQGKFWSVRQFDANASSSTCHLCTILNHHNWIRRRKTNGSFLEVPVEPGDLRWALGMSRDKDAYAAQLRLFGLDYEKSHNMREMASVQVRLFSVPNGTNTMTWPIVKNTSTWSLETVHLLKGWLSECFRHHPHCGNRAQIERLPLRLLDVNPQGYIRACSKEAFDLAAYSVEAAPDVRVCMTTSLPQNTEYLTLSHRWDTRPLLQLTHDTTRLFEKNIPVELLHQIGAKTFRDAIQVVRCLGYRYLWIDAICINQENVLEKAAEIGHMDRIYANAVANISATGAARAADGLFFKRNVSTVSPCYKRFSRVESLPQETLDLVAYYNSSWNHNVSLEPLNRRAWVYQESMLAPRVIHFARQQIYWECFTVNASEGSPDGQLDSPGVVDYKTIIAEKNSLSKVDIDAIRLWQLMVFHYSHLSLTYPRDRLPALSALARHVCKKRLLRPEDYFAGHWRPDFPSSLVWAVTQCDDLAEKKLSDHGRLRGEYLAPTWSWASVKGGVHDFTYHLRSPLAVSIDAAVTNRHGDTFGQITSGHLSLQCSLCRVLWHPVCQWTNFLLSDGRIWHQKTFDNYHDFFFNEGRLFLSWDSNFFDNRVAPEDLWIPLSDSKLQISKNSFHLAPITEHPERGIEGLILHRTSLRGQFARVGSFTIFTAVQKPCNTNDDSYMSEDPDTEPTGDDRAVVTNEFPLRETDTGFDFLKVILNNEVTLDADDCLEATEDGKYIIEIV